MLKIVRIGTVPTDGGGRVSVFCKLADRDGYVSFTGVVGPTQAGNAYGGAGQIDMGFAHRDPADNDDRYTSPTEAEAFNFASGWDAEKWLDFLDAWKRWHMKRDPESIEAAKQYAATLPDTDRTPAWV